MTVAGERPERDRRVTEEFNPHPLLRSAHVQTLLGSRGRGIWVNRRAHKVVSAAQRVVLTCSAGVRLESWVSSNISGAPTVILIHGWLGHADSSYVLSAAAHLWECGFSVIRLNLRDHGATAHLNKALFHSARIREVVAAVQQLEDNHATGPCGLAGFSLGGNFALRVARARAVDDGRAIETIAVCPAINPAATTARIDSGWVGYQLFFVRKWQRALRAKKLAFPALFEFEQALQLKSVAALTDLFVAVHTDFQSTRDYFAAYALTGDHLADTRATILYAADDPVIPSEDFAHLPPSITLKALKQGGHCAFIDNLRKATWADRYLSSHFRRELRT